MDLQKHIGNRIREMRIKRNIDMDVLAEMFDTTKQSISRYERGERQVNQDMLFKLSEIFGVGIDDFFPDKEVDNAPHEYNYEYYQTPVSAGELCNIEGSAPERIRMSNAVMGKYAGNSDVFFIRVNGDSMNKVIPHESMIAVQRVNLDALKNNDIVVFSNDHEYSVKRYYNDAENERFIFSPESTDRIFTDHTVPYTEAENLVMHGKVVLYIVKP